MHRPDAQQPQRPERAALRGILIVAAAGYGKSTWLMRARPADGVVVPAAELTTSALPDVDWLGVDDLHLIEPTAQASLLRRLVRQRDSGRGDHHLAIVSGAPLSDRVRAEIRGRLSERDATDLALQPYTVARLLAEEFGVDDPETALRVADVTAGWPMLVRWAGDALRRDRHVNLVEALTGSDAPAATWLAQQGLGALAGRSAAILRAVADVDPGCPVTPGVVERLTRLVDPSSAHRPPQRLITRLQQLGLLSRRRRVGRQGAWVMVPAVALLLRQSRTDRQSSTAAALAGAYESERLWMPAALAAAATGDRAKVVALIDERGDEMLRHGDANLLIGVVEQVLVDSTGVPPQRLQRIYADALRMTGQPAPARRAFRGLVEAACSDGWSADLATRVVNLHYMCGEFETALEILDLCDESRLSAPPSPEELIVLLALRGQVLTMLGREGEARDVATRALDLADRLGAARLLGVAHVAMAKACPGPSAELHLEQALQYAGEADDAVTTTRVLAEQTYRLLAKAQYEDASAVAREAARMARAAAPPGLQASILHNLGEALARTGRLDEALWHLECSVALCRRLGPARAALGLVGVAGIHRLRAQRERSLAAYREAIELSRGSGDAQVLVCALSGLAILTARDQPPVARSAAAEAVALAGDDLRALALTASGRVALAQGERQAATALAQQAVDAARVVAAADLLADARELEAAATESLARARSALEEALAIWSTGGAEPDRWRVEAVLGGLPDADGAQRARARCATRSLLRLGVPPPAGTVGDATGAQVGGAPRGSVAIHVLGPFRVVVEGAEVPLTAWRSRQARILIKVLVAQRGRVVTRDRLRDLLWPDDDPARTGHRLSVLLATVRGVLDPGKTWTADRYIRADQIGLRLDLDAVALDAEMLLRDAAYAAELVALGDLDNAREAYEHVDALYRGEAFDDESDGWAEAFREEIRETWSRSMRRLVNLTYRAGRGPEALAILNRLLAADPYDEPIHRRLVIGLVQAGRHGEALRAFERWSRAMNDIDAPPPDPRLIAVTPSSPGRRRSDAVVMAS